ncbi:isochorismate synthase [Verminephrobacter aporrectodeae subsp. tuberculatae]|uniref:isochorismate synthase n=1 Tax=Verminephrobacter aporrectodeae TaxID=1110389 RepID=UPI0022378B16|nr:isochorismate synthase [Verminephrobacter aporrectodeae]MCW5256024.1 isochorismate synthase [Verminephrobacter aporrectodeae subsp. tuberculatae]
MSAITSNPTEHSPTSSPADADAQSLLAQVRPSTPLFIASPRHTLLASSLHGIVAPGAASLPSRVRKALARATATGAAAPVAVGAVPFDPTRPAALSVAPTLRRARALPPAAPLRGERLPCRMRAVPTGADYTVAVAEAVRRIALGEIDKVVLARTLELASDRPVELPTLLARLASRNPLGYTFSVALGDGRTLLGASPELLVSRSDGMLRANPLAGSAPRAADPQEDRRRAQALLVSRKDLEEHRLVVEAVAHALRPLCPQLQVPARPSLVHTPAMWHLSTEISGATEADALTLALALHPTPAVCGLPRGRAHALIQQLEPFDRAFYAGAFGWTDAYGDGEWVVAIRCAELKERQLRLFSGAGIVAQSQPEAELAETAAKFRTMLDALGLAHEEADQPATAETLA